jgi:hypothetical protein
MANMLSIGMSAGRSRLCQEADADLAQRRIVSGARSCCRDQTFVMPQALHDNCSHRFSDVTRAETHIEHKGNNASRPDRTGKPLGDPER